MQIELVETFLDLAETRSFHRTAEKLGVTQSTVSARIHALENALGRRLFTRSRAGTDLTTDGLKFEPHARALRRAWAETLRAMRPTGNAAVSLRLGLQHDLAVAHIGDWVSEFRRALPQAAFYIELDFSIQVCADLVTGVQDLGVIFTPRALPDLHFENVGSLRYRLISTETDRRAGLRAETHIRAEYSPAFDSIVRETLPDLVETPIATGQNAAVAGLLATLGGSAFVLEETAQAMVAAGRAQVVADVGPIEQPVFAALHVRNRASQMHRRLLSIVKGRFGAPVGRARR